MSVTTLSLDEILDLSELALREAASSAHAARIAGEAAEQAAATVGDGDIAEAWSKLARDASGIAFGHGCRAAKFSPGGPAARAAKESADLAAASAEAAETAVEAAKND